MLPLLLTAAARGKTTIEDIVRLCSYAPARRWSLSAKGQVAPGFDADLVLVDPDAEAVVDATSMHSKHNVTPYEGWPLTGAVAATYLRGGLVYEKGTIIGDPTGRQVRPARVPLSSASV
jgi:dihydroorotase-like cyclic amidohydrolase